MDVLADSKFKRTAREKCKQALKTGKLVRQPCEKCGESKSHAHHDDYSKPLAVRWLCFFHHSEIHPDLPIGNATKTFCKNGHPLKGSHVTVNRYGRRRCRICRNADERRRARSSKRRPSSEGLETSVFLGRPEDLTFCKKGHAMFGPNVSCRKVGSGVAFVCRQCASDASKKWSKSPKGVAWDSAWRSSPEGRASHREADKRYKLRSKRLSINTTAI